MSIYLEDHPPARSQFRRTRRAKPTGACVLHTAESSWTGGPEPVARFIARRPDPGSYHLLGGWVSDLQHAIIQLCRFEWEAFGDGTGSNPWAVHISLAMHAADWPSLSSAPRDVLVNAAVDMAHRAASWLRGEHGIIVPARRITKAESDAGLAGFISHADRDPARRSDPGPGFPWDDFLSRYAALTGQTPQGATMPADPHTGEIQAILTDAGFSPGPIDRIPGPRTVAAVHALANEWSGRGDVIAELTDRIADLEAGNVPPDDTADTVIGREAVALFRRLQARSEA